MLRISDMTLPLTYDEHTLRSRIAEILRCREQDILDMQMAKRAVDARRAVHFIAAVDVVVRDERRILSQLSDNTHVRQITPYALPQYPQEKKLPHRPVIVGCGPAGLFAAYTLAQAGLRPVILERGKCVTERQKAVLRYQMTGVLDPECNVQFGEGGAGTFSDGKLNTGTRDPRIRQVLNALAEFGAPPEILWQAKPHVGTDRLAVCISALRRHIVRLGGKVLFSAKCTGLTAENGAVVSVEYEQNGETHSLRTDHVILAVGHSARDVFTWLRDMNLPMEQKPFSLGLRIEHPQKMIDRFCYRAAAGHPSLGAASYKLAVHTDSGRGVYSFCMCPGGIVQAAASEPETVVTNGMSFYARDGRNANSALLVGITPEDFGSEDVLAGMELQRKIEQAAYRTGGCTGKAPVTLLEDFLRQRESKAFGDVLPTYPLGTVFAPPECCLPEFVCEALRAGIPLMERQLRGFTAVPDAVLTAPETRSSSPVRILRRKDTLESTGMRGLYPCGEGAGYAGGIVSAAADGIRCAERILSAAT